MDTIRKRPAPPHESRDTATETNRVAKPDVPAPPLDLLFSLDASLPKVSEKPSADNAHEPLPTYPPLFRRIRPRPGRLTAPPSVSAPDWKLSTGAAVILLGFAIAFGTYITLTERDAMQSRLRRIVGQNELRASQHHDRGSIADRTQELARTLREQIETLRSRDATDTAVVAGAATHMTANAHSSALASSSPGLPPTSTTTSPSASHGKTPAKQLAAKPLAPPLPQPAPRTRQVASAAPARPHSTTTPAKQEHRTSMKQANTQNTPKPVKVAAKTATPKTTTKTKATRSAMAKAPAKPAPRIVPPTVQAWTPPDDSTASPASDDTQIYRQH
ncbi:hypothetical protein G3N95_40010 [Paraburkholderia sp. Tr-20389]|uniref:hypothetical protein n=1 Tax=Paraburkholderia sp. Tr-20389 TaxID=2703903 RepID=UPI00197F83DC|nr:hypothetical protein [Paraburkholderia sp. Tr-20389]MBN3759149.1 hypothetical protein [Paraburkholderia sp. Tr-20389]